MGLLSASIYTNLYVDFYIPLHSFTVLSAASRGDMTNKPNEAFTIKIGYKREDVLGKGAYGVVFKGILVDKYEVKVKDVANDNSNDLK